jgi:ParB/RepB/Spo0J family partition protein
MKKMPEQIIEVELSKLVKSPYNVRVEAVVVGELAKNIKKNGLHDPIKIRPKGKKYEVVDGNRRWKAFEINGEKKIPAFLNEMTDGEALLYSLTETLHKLDNSPEEKARAIAIALGRNELLTDKDPKLSEKERLTERALAETLGMTHQAINQMLEPLRQAKETRELVKDGRITEATAKSIRQFVKDDKKQEVKVAKAIADKELKQIEALDVISKVSKQKGTVDDLITKIKGEDKIKTSEIEKNLITKTDDALTSTPEKKSVVGSASASDLNIDIPETTKSTESKPEGVTSTITDKKVVSALNKCATKQKTTVDEIVLKAVKSYLKKVGYKV